MLFDFSVSQFFFLFLSRCFVLINKLNSFTTISLKFNFQLQAQQLRQKLVTGVNALVAFEMSLAQGPQWLQNSPPDKLNVVLRNVDADESRWILE